MTEERRKHPPECLMLTEWGTIKEFTRNTELYRSGLCLKLEDIRKENKERFEILLAQIRADKADRDSDIVVIHDRISQIKKTASSIVFWGVCSLITFAVSWGALNNTVNRNTVIIRDLELITRELHNGAKKG
jgi:hypothetical protein